MTRRVLIENARILARAKELADEISALCGGEINMVWIAEGAATFASDLARLTSGNVRLSSVKCSTYGAGKSPQAKPKIIGDLSAFAGKKILLVDDILDTGATARAAVSALKNNGAAEVKTCFLLRRTVPSKADFRADFVGFDIGAEFVFGYGLDDALKCRELQDICFNCDD